jgi:hypothetical protein
MTASELKAEIGGLYDAWFAAALSRDAAFFREVLADDWYYVDIAGTVRDREQYVDMLDLVPTDATMRMVGFTVRERGSTASRAGGQAVTSWPASRILPAVRYWNPVRAFTSVVLPAPFGPIRPRISPRRSSRSTPSIARTPSKCTCTPRASSTSVVPPTD